MKPIICKLFPSLLLASILMLTSAPALPMNRDNQQPIYLDSAKQAVDMATNTLILTGDVVLKRGSIDIRADKVVITRTGGKNGHQVAEGYGNPVCFYQLQSNGKPVRGHAQKVRYEIVNDLVILTGNAYLEQWNSNVKSDHITYLIKKQQMQAFSNKGKRVITVLDPAQYQDKIGFKLPMKSAK